MDKAAGIAPNRVAEIAPTAVGCGREIDGQKLRALREPCALVCRMIDIPSTNYVTLP